MARYRLGCRTCRTVLHPPRRRPRDGYTLSQPRDIDDHLYGPVRGHVGLSVSWRPSLVVIPRPAEGGCRTVLHVLHPYWRSLAS
jgi:hypothetical protein